MKHRHMHAKKRASGGATKPEFYAGAGSNVAKEAEEKKHGGKVKRKHGGTVHGHHAKHRLDRPGRKRGGAVGADMRPLSSAYRETNAKGHPTEDDD